MVRSDIPIVRLKVIESMHTASRGTRFLKSIGLASILSLLATASAFADAVKLWDTPLPLPTSSTTPPTEAALGYQLRADGNGGVVAIYTYRTAGDIELDPSGVMLVWLNQSGVVVYQRFFPWESQNEIYIMGVNNKGILVNSFNTGVTVVNKDGEETSLNTADPETEGYIELTSLFRNRQVSVFEDATSFFLFKYTPTSPSQLSIVRIKPKR